MGGYLLSERVSQNPGRPGLQEAPIYPVGFPVVGPGARGADGGEREDIN